MTVILAIDPGPTMSGWALTDDLKVIDSGVHPNGDVRVWVKHGQGADLLAIETMQANYAATVGASVIETLVWVGRFKEAWHTPDEVRLISRQVVKAAVCNGNTRANDAGVRQALIDLIGPPGTKKKPGPTYGVTSHAWSALAVAVAVGNAPVTG